MNRDIYLLDYNIYTYVHAYIHTYKNQIKLYLKFYDVWRWLLIYKWWFESCNKKIIEINIKVKLFKKIIINVSSKFQKCNVTANTTTVSK